MKKSLSVILALLLTVPCLVPAMSAAEYYLSLSGKVEPDTGADVSDAIQAVIDGNPNRTIFFPDGEYLISKPIVTPALPAKSVSLLLSDYAVIKAAPDFEGDALVILGGKDPANDNRSKGSNYSLTGGIIDGSGIADGVEIAGGRETAVRQVSIKRTVVGVHILYGANSGSSDADIRDLNIVGSGGTDSVGILVEGYDNTITNVRICDVYTGVHLKSAGNCLRNIHPLFTVYPDYSGSCGFISEGGANLFDFCYSDNFHTAFLIKNGVENRFNDCFTYWYSAEGGEEICFRAEGGFNSIATNTEIGFRSETKNVVLKTDRTGSGIIQNLIVDEKRAADDLTYKLYMEDNLAGRIRLLIARLRNFFRTFSGLFR